MDDRVAHSGKRSLKINHKKATSYSMMTRQVEFDPHKQYIITGWIKGENIKPGDGAEDFALLSMLRDRGARQKAQTLAEAVVANPQPATLRAAR